MTQILISGSNEDKTQIRMLEAALTASNIECWWDERNTIVDDFGQTVDAEAKRALLVITLWSSHSILSQLIQKTAYEARIAGRWLSVLIEDVQIPPKFSDVGPIDLGPWLRWRDNSNFLSLLTEAEHILTQGSIAQSAEKVKLTSTLRLARHLAPLVAEELLSLNAEHPLFEFSTSQHGQNKWSVGDWSVDVAANKISLAHLERTLNRRSMDLLEYFMRNCNITLSMEQILSAIWPDTVVEDNAVHRCVSDLRSALDDDSRNSKYIQTIPRRGYRLIAAVERVS